MGRKSIATMAAVEDAANILSAAGRPVSASTVRRIIGGGSLSTIQSHLESWRSARRPSASDTETVILPAPLRESIDQLKRDSDTVLRFCEMHFAQTSPEGFLARIRDLETKLDSKERQIEELKEKVALLETLAAEARQEDDPAALAKEETVSSSKAGMAESEAREEKALQKPKKSKDKDVDDDRQQSLF